MDNGFHISVREAVEPYANVVVSGPSVGAAAEFKATIYGPQCAYARTLPTTFTPTARDKRQVDFLIQDPCYWTPALPFLYELSVEWVNSAGEPHRGRHTFGLRRLMPRRNSLYLAGERFVPRGVHASSITDEIASQARSAEVALIVPAPSSEELNRANVHGVSVVADLRGRSFEQAPWVGSMTDYPSVLMTIIDGSQVDQLVSARVAEDGLVAVVIGPEEKSPEATLPPWRCLIAVELGPGDRPPPWAANCGRPVIAIRRGGTYADFQAARAACDNLQADLAPEFDFAGYFV